MHHVFDDERDGGRERMAVISMQQTEHCISTILMWWSRSGHRQTALSSSSLLCTHQGLCRDQQPTTVVREQQMGRTRVCQVYIVHFLATTGASGLIKEKIIVFLLRKIPCLGEQFMETCTRALFANVSFISKSCVGSICDLAITQATMCKCVVLYTRMQHMPRMPTGSAPRAVVHYGIAFGNQFSICSIVSIEVQGGSISRGSKKLSGFTDPSFVAASFSSSNSNCRASSAAASSPSASSDVK